jgi:DNA-binding response OmpR family regulator
LSAPFGGVGTAEDLNVPTVLLVEDDRTLGAALVSLFSGEGYEVDYAADGVVALEHIETYRPDIVVTDVMMPRLDGIGLVKSLRERGHQVPVIMISANNVNPQQPGVRFVAKPFDIECLLAAVHDACSAVE